MTVNELNSCLEPGLVVIVDSVTTGVARQNVQDCQSTSDPVAWILQVSHGPTASVVSVPQRSLWARFRRTKALPFGLFGRTSRVTSTRVAWSALGLPMAQTHRTTSDHNVHPLFYQLGIDHPPSPPLGCRVTKASSWRQGLTDEGYMLSGSKAPSW